jgi:cytidine deaminase
VDAEDNKLVVLARATRSRAGSNSAAAIRDLDGRTYAAAGIELRSLQLSAVAAAISMAFSSGAQGLEAVIVFSEDAVSETDMSVVREFAGEGISVSRVSASGAVLEQLIS